MGEFRPKKYFFGFGVLLFAFGILFLSGVPILPGFWTGVILSLYLSFIIYSIRLYIIWKHSKEGFAAQLGTTVLSFFIQAACLLLFVWRGEREGFIIGFFIAHFANLLIVVFAR